MKRLGTMKLIRSIDFKLALIATGLLSVQWLAAYAAIKFLSFSKLSVVLPTYKDQLAIMAGHDFSSSKAFVDMIDWIRLNAPEKTFKPPPPPQDATSRRRFLCVGIITQARKSALIRYFNVILMALITRIPIKHHDDVAIYILNTDDELFYYKQELAKLTNIFYVDNITSGVHHPYPKTKEAADYALAMKYLHSKKCNYSFILEDDGMASYDWLEKIRSSMNYIEANFDSDEWMCVKVYTGFKYLDWTLHSFTVLKAVVYSLILAALNQLTLKHLILFRFKQRVAPRSFVLGNILIYLSSFLLVFLLVSVSKSPLGDGVKMYSQGRNTIGVLFNPRNVIQLSDHILNVVDQLLTKKSSYIRPKDILLNDFKKLNRLNEFIIEPSVFQHIGMHSSLSMRDFESLEILGGIYKSYSFPDDSKPIRFEPNYWTQH